jgi:hypothetical protein
MNEIVQYRPELELLTKEYQRCTEAERTAAGGYLQAATNRGEALHKIKAACKYGEWGSWCKENDIDRTTAWQYMQLFSGQIALQKLLSSDKQPVSSIREALRILSQERKLEKEAEGLQSKIVEASKRLMKTLVDMREFLEKNPDAEFDVTTEFIFSIDETKIALDNLNGRLHYDRSDRQTNPGGE